MNGINVTIIELGPLHLLENSDGRKNKQEFLGCKLDTKRGNAKVGKNIRLAIWNFGTLTGKDNENSGHDDKEKSKNFMFTRDKMYRRESYDVGRFRIKL